MESVSFSLTSAKGGGMEYRLTNQEVNAIIAEYLTTNYNAKGKHVNFNWDVDGNSKSLSVRVEFADHSFKGESAK
jgi:hypothetical protein